MSKLGLPENLTWSTVREATVHVWFYNAVIRELVRARTIAAIELMIELYEVVAVSLLAIDYCSLPNSDMNVSEFAVSQLYCSWVKAPRWASFRGVVGCFYCVPAMWLPLRDSESNKTK